MANPNLQNTADELAKARNRARLERLMADSSPGSSLAMGRAADGASAQAQQRMAQTLQAAQQGRQPTAFEQQAIAGKLQADRIRDARARQIQAEQKKGQKGKEKTGQETPDYPNPIKLGAFIGFGFVAMMQDLLPLIFDLLAIGWIIEYCLLPITWSAYWYFIVRQAPRSLKKKFWQRTILVTAVGWIPFVGQFIPEWTATAIGAYVVIAIYQRRKAAEGAGEKAKSTSAAGTPAPAAAIASKAA
ncbi:MAG: hypothetical protein HY461_00590 [Parcubacteria group bacterium]|nr:hypothetical protein [Parcubacteria group bacterium]